ncbi:hypothetical protein ACN4EE_02410 [Geminocystis sp. CENA526]|uniref:hypothetical protein n=1 Tax=Geminocystis sp. CENA526 TaxID=1355871 RepID=UPI003D6E5C14
MFFVSLFPVITFFCIKYLSRSNLLCHCEETKQSLLDRTPFVIARHEAISPPSNFPSLSLQNIK